jgi:hypothetical protein
MSPTVYAQTDLIPRPSDQAGSRSDCQEFKCVRPPSWFQFDTWTAQDFPVSSARLARTHQPARNSSTRSGTRPTVSSSVSGPANPRWTSSTCARSKAPACPSRSFASHMPDAFITMRNCGLQSTIDNYNKFGNFV